MMRVVAPILLALTLALTLALSGAAVGMAETRVPVSQGEISLSFAPLVKHAAPAVVNIYASRVVEARTSPFADDPFFREFFRDFGQTRPQVQNSLGSGVILSADGIVVSNHHVVEQADDIRVVLNDRREYRARILLADAEADLAILKLEDADEMPHLALRDSDGVEVGELVLAIGNPFGVGQTVTSGIVSGLARSGTATGNARGYFIQTDAPINPGNSGGALIDVNGDLIGVNTSILSKSGGSNGIGFAIPASLVQQFVRQARAGATVFRRPWAGLNGQPVDAGLAEGLGLDRPGGIVISDLHPASPFRQAGVLPGDVVLAVGGQPVNTPAEMIYRMGVAGEGAELPLRIFRAGEVLNLTVRLTAPAEDPPRDARVSGRDTPIPELALVRINPAVLAEFGLPLTAEGAVVTDPGPFGARAGLRRGDVITAVNGVAVQGSADAISALGESRNRLTLDIQRGLERLSLRFRL
ncbi:trypsin-like peptidase domain-containing protein [Pseudooceanicola sp.]|uniref:trypsin-like peptidase domain-containing protein n=1 Tax=Pseudooceanicola sp. TaxID=1914328 RepID=UPI002618AB4A|nr:trypsin-like peptidase domain-containing protein [Pseudooceanicola sp.]MDF1856930.1 trypsin-like peptidase domain-containing protein [Pseudooceanicola sp.]